MLTEQKINEIINASGVVITKADEGHIKGIITDPQSQKKTKFSLAWCDNYANLTIKGKEKDKSLVEVIKNALNMDYIKGEVNTWTGKEEIYFWHNKPEDKTETLRALQMACAMNNGMFSFLGWQNTQLISA